MHWWKKRKRAKQRENKTLKRHTVTEWDLCAHNNILMWRIEICWLSLFLGLALSPSCAVAEPKEQGTVHVLLLWFSAFSSLLCSLPSFRLSTLSATTTTTQQQQHAVHKKQNCTSHTFKWNLYTYRGIERKKERNECILRALALPNICLFVFKKKSWSKNWNRI